MWILEPVSVIEWSDSMIIAQYAVIGSFIGVAYILMIVLWVFVVRQRIRVRFNL